MLFKKTKKIDEIDNAHFGTDLVADEKAILAKPGRFRKAWLLAGPIFTGIFFFITGLIIFFPKDDIFQSILAKARFQGYPVYIDKTSISLTGNYEFERFSYDLKSSLTSNENQIKMAYMNGHLSFWSLLFDNTIDFEQTARGVFVPLDVATFSGGDWNFLANLENVKDGMDKISGKLNIGILNSMVKIPLSLPVVLPGIGDSIQTNIRRGNLNGRLQTGALIFDISEIDSDLARVIIQGRILLNNQNQINLQVIIFPTQQFFELSPGIKELLENFGYLQKDGKIELMISGTPAKLQTRPVQVLGTNN